MEIANMPKAGTSHIYDVNKINKQNKPQKGGNK